MTTNPKLQAILAAAKARTQATVNTSALPSSAQIAIEPEENTSTTISAYKEVIVTNEGTYNPYYIEGVGELNEQQRQAVKLFGIEGQSGCLIGPAGTGKTTTVKAIVRAMILSGRIPILPDEATHKYLQTGIPGIFGGSFTRIATRNLRDNIPDDIKPNIHTIHRLLEYEPVFKDVIDEKTGDIKTVRYFAPTRNQARPLPKELKVIMLDESSMVGCNLHSHLENASASSKAQFLYIGDIAQIPPVMDDSILGYKLLDLPVVELTHVYRHAGAIVNLATHIRLGNTIPSNREVVPYAMNLKRLPKKLVADSIALWNKEEDGSKVTIHLWKTRLEGEVGQLKALQNLSNFFKKEIDSGNYIPEEHMILIPYNKAVGTLELNKYISEYLGKKRNALVYEVIAGFNKHYFAVGDKVFYDREEAVITKINRNALYQGKLPQKEATTLDRWGHNIGGNEQTLDQDEFDSIDNLLNISVAEDEERKNQASHVVYVRKLAQIGEDDDKEYSVQTSSEVNTLIGGYALTIHKSQGSQWKKVYCVFHNSHNRNLQRELLYTAITRAQKELYVICEPETFVQGVLSQHIVGNTLAQKAEYFKGKRKINEANLFNGDIQ